VRHVLNSAHTTQVSLVSPQLSDRVQPPQISNKSRAKAVTGMPKSTTTRRGKPSSKSMRSAESEAPQPALAASAESDETVPQSNPSITEPAQVIERATNLLTSTVGELVEPWIVSWRQR